MESIIGGNMANKRTTYLNWKTDRESDARQLARQKVEPKQHFLTDKPNIHFNNNGDMASSNMNWEKLSLPKKKKKRSSSFFGLL